MTTIRSRSRLLGRYAKLSARSKAQVIKRKLSDQLHFVGALVQSPRQTGAIAPTSTELAALMAGNIDLTSDLPVLELGPGTGAITKTILAAGLKPSRLTLVEFDHNFCRILRRQYPGINVIQGDAFDLDATLRGVEAQPFDCIISGLPLLNFTDAKRSKLLQSVLDRLLPGRPFVQFSYGVRAPIDVTDGNISVSKSPWVWKNLPPARVWTYRRLS